MFEKLKRIWEVAKEQDARKPESIADKISSDKFKEFTNAKEEWEMPTLTIADRNYINKIIAGFSKLAFLVGILLGMIFMLIIS